MKKTLAVLMGLMGAAAFAGVNNVVISFSTPGPDKYADGSAVVDGESYALVWTPNDATFAGFGADGAAIAPSKTVIKAPVAKDGKCPNVLFEVDEAYANANYPNGTWGVYLLDTRVYQQAADGSVVTDDNGVAQVASVGGKVAGYAKATTLAGTTLASGTAAGGVSVAKGTATGVKVNDVKLIGDNVYIYVSGAGKFELGAGDLPDDLKAEGKDRSVNAEGEAIIIRAKKSGGEFFTVNAK